MAQLLLVSPYWGTTVVPCISLQHAEHAKSLGASNRCERKCFRRGRGRFGDTPPLLPFSPLTPPRRPRPLSPLLARCRASEQRAPAGKEILSPLSGCLVPVRQTGTTKSNHTHHQKKHPPLCYSVVRVVLVDDALALSPLNSTATPFHPPTTPSSSSPHPRPPPRPRLPLGWISFTVTR